MSQAVQAVSKPLGQIAKKLRSTNAKVRSRIDTVSPHLCDDTLQRLAPSLEKYKGCTIIDINPGFGLWSSKIHEVLQPHKHILAEPSPSPFLPRLEPLVSQPNSRYCLLDWGDGDQWEPDRFVAEGLLPAFDTHRSRGSNRSILVLANGSMSSGRLADQHRYARTHLKLLDWVSDIRKGSGFHAGGSVRMLLWCPEKETFPLMPRTIQYRSKISLQLEMACHVEEIVSSGDTIRGKQQKRDQVIDLSSGRRVARTMQQLGIEVPPGRQIELQEQTQDFPAKVGSDDATQQPSASSVQARGWHEELQDLRKMFQAGEFAQAEGLPLGKSFAVLPRGTGSKMTPEYARLVELERNLRHTQKRIKLVEELLQEQANIDALDLKAHDPALGERQRAAALREKHEKKKELEERLDNTKGAHTRQEFEYFKTDRKAYAQNPPLLMWDRRTAEPLKAYKEEFYPEKGLCLLDIEPIQPCPYPMTTAQDTFFSMLMTTLWQNASDNLTVLDRIVPGAFDAVTSKVPPLRDPSRGGERSLRDLPIRRLTPEMAYGITMAWLNWPFKPDLVELLRKGSIYDDQDILRTARGKTNA
ncbi:MAG: hypothetical protein Q9181_003556 [Wetmoreana brouardii]